jgi:hypothetical protein
MTFIRVEKMIALYIFDTVKYFQNNFSHCWVPQKNAWLFDLCAFVSKFLINIYLRNFLSCLPYIYSYSKFLTLYSKHLHQTASVAYMRHDFDWREMGACSPHNILYSSVYPRLCVVRFMMALTVKFQDLAVSPMCHSCKVFSRQVTRVSE